MYILIYETVKGKNVPLLRGPITTEPYKHWFEAGEVQLGSQARSGPQGVSSEQEKLVYQFTEVSIDTEFLDL